MLSPEVVDDEGGFIILHIEIQESPYVLINYYVPNIELNQVRKLQQIKSNFCETWVSMKIHNLF